MNPETLWLPAIASAIVGIPASVLAGIALVLIRRVLHAARGAEQAAGEASTHARASATSTATTALDVASLQGRLRQIDLELGELRDGVSVNLAARLEQAQLESRIQRLEEFMEMIERNIHAQGVDTGALSR